jgi:N-acetylglucosaminyldiphosphoundecaprenol N-acetyl-beta-D-mannosaminyltransferase
MEATQINSMNLLGSHVAVTNEEELCHHVLSKARLRTPAFVCYTTAHMLVAATRVAQVRTAYRKAHLVSPDGVPVAWMLRLCGRDQAQCVSGPRSLPMLLKGAEERQLNVGFYGGRPKTLALLSERAKSLYPSIRLTYCFSPPFRPLDAEEQAQHLNEINQAEVHLLFVGLGSPKQECWMEQYSSQLRCVCLGVGAAFEFFSGEKVLPPVWVQYLGLNWLVRLCQEPRRLLGRNLYSPLFVLLALRWLLMEEAARSRWEQALDLKLSRLVNTVQAHPTRASGSRNLTTMRRSRDARR